MEFGGPLNSRHDWSLVPSEESCLLPATAESNRCWGKGRKSSQALTPLRYSVSPGVSRCYGSEDSLEVLGFSLLLVATETMLGQVYKASKKRGEWDGDKLELRRKWTLTWGKVGGRSCSFPRAWMYLQAHALSHMCRVLRKWSLEIPSETWEDAKPQPVLSPSADPLVKILWGFHVSLHV